MAGDLGSVDPAQHQTLMGWLGGLATATVGAVGLWLAQRVLGKAAFQTAINDGFAKLTTELQEERDRLHREIAAERLAWTEERGHLKGRIRQLEQTVASLKNQLRVAGVDIPADPHAIEDADPGAVIL